MKKIVLLLNNNDDARNAGPKAQLDISKFLGRFGFKRVALNVNNTSILSKTIFAKVVLPRFIKNNKDIDEIVIQYPMSQFLMRNLITNLRKQTHAHIYCVIHDIEALRIKLDDNSFKKKEISLLNSVDGVIAHNRNMLRWLRQNGLVVNAVPLELFDYDNPQVLNRKINYNYSICFAGNLAKAEFLKKIRLKKNIKLYLYGSNFSKEMQKNNIYYNGSFSPNELPKYLVQSFGLVWDGNSVDSCNGVYGNYTRYNAPHKVSLYLSCGIPVIVWKKAGIAKYIINNGLGIAIDSLSELNSLFNNISFNDYKALRGNCIKEASKIRNGEYIHKAISTLEKIC